MGVALAVGVGFGFARRTSWDDGGRMLMKELLIWCPGLLVRRILLALGWKDRSVLCICIHYLWPGLHVVHYHFRSAKGARALQAGGEGIYRAFPPVEVPSIDQEFHPRSTLRCDRTSLKHPPIIKYATATGRLDTGPEASTRTLHYRSTSPNLPQS